MVADLHSKLEFLGKKPVGLRPPPEGIAYVPYQDEDDMQGIVDLIEKDLSEPYSIFTYRYFIHGWPHLCILAKKDGKCVGVVVCKVDEHGRHKFRGYIAMLAVENSIRGGGIGSSLVQICLQRMEALKADECVLEAEVTNEGALALYRNMGFVRDKRLHKYYLNGNDAYRLKLIFNHPDINQPSPDDLVEGAGELDGGGQGHGYGHNHEGDPVEQAAGKAKAEEEAVEAQPGEETVGEKSGDQGHSHAESHAESEDQGHGGHGHSHAESEAHGHSHEGHEACDGRDHNGCAGEHGEGHGHSDGHSHGGDKCEGHGHSHGDGKGEDHGQGGHGHSQDKCAGHGHSHEGDDCKGHGGGHGADDSEGHSHGHEKASEAHGHGH